MDNEPTDRPAGTIADPTALLALSRQRGRQYSMYYVLLGAAAIVSGFILAALRPVIALPAALLVVVACLVPMVRFAQRHQHLVGQLNRLAPAFWIVYVLAMAIMVVGALHGTRGYPNTLTLILLGALLGLLDGLVVGHFTDQASKRRTSPDLGTTVH